MIDDRGIFHLCYYYIIINVLEWLATTIVGRHGVGMGREIYCIASAFLKNVFYNSLKI